MGYGQSYGWQGGKVKQMNRKQRKKLKQLNERFGNRGPYFGQNSNCSVTKGKGVKNVRKTK